jgi:hypothetical protein
MQPLWHAQTKDDQAQTNTLHIEGNASLRIPCSPPHKAHALSALDTSTHGTGASGATNLAAHERHPACPMPSALA